MTTAEAQPLLKAVQSPGEIPDNGRNDLIAPTTYTIITVTAALIAIIYQLRDAITTRTPGSTALAFS
jgi:hypothetical protein